MERMSKNQQKHSIFYADDDEDDIMFLREAFRSYAANVELITAFDGLEALSYLSNLSSVDPSPCLIILDVNMPKMNGKELLKEIRNLHRFEAIPVVLFTTSTLPPDKAFAANYKAGFMTKPVDEKQLAAIADQFVEHCTDEIRKSLSRYIS